jgi:magnesium-transporting ATPase (P-type)
MATTKTSAPKDLTPKGNQTFLFDKSNYMWVIGGVVLIILGFVLMAGGKSEDPNKFNYEEIYSARRITVAPLLILIGFAVEIYAIMKKPAESNS